MLQFVHLCSCLYVPPPSFPFIPRFRPLPATLFGQPVEVGRRIPLPHQHSQWLGQVTIAVKEDGGCVVYYPKRLIAVVLGSAAILEYGCRAYGRPSFISFCISSFRSLINTYRSGLQLTIILDPVHSFIKNSREQRRLRTRQKTQQEQQNEEQWRTIDILDCKLQSTLSTSTVVC